MSDPMTDPTAALIAEARAQLAASSNFVSDEEPVIYCRRSLITRLASTLTQATAGETVERVCRCEHDEHDHFVSPDRRCVHADCDCAQFWHAATRYTRTVQEERRAPFGESITLGSDWDDEEERSCHTKK